MDGPPLFWRPLPGGSDPAILFILASFLLYFRAWKSNATERLQEWRPFLGYIITTTLAGGLGYVHCLKWIIGRARPNLVWDKQWPFSEWYEFGPHYIAEGITGEVSQVVTPPSSLCRCPVSNLADRLQVSKAEVSDLLGNRLYSASGRRGSGNSMTAHHWISDSLGIFGPVALIAYWLYFDFWKFPSRGLTSAGIRSTRDATSLGVEAAGGVFSDSRIDLLVLGATLCATAQFPVLGLAPAGAVLMTWGFLRIQRIYSDLFEWLHHWCELLSFLKLYRLIQKLKRKNFFKSYWL